MSWLSLLLVHNDSPGGDPFVQAFDCAFHHEEVHDAALFKACSGENIQNDTSLETISTAETVLKADSSGEAKKRIQLPCGRRVELSECADEEPPKHPDPLGPLCLLTHKSEMSNGHAACDTDDSMLRGLEVVFKHKEDAPTTTQIWCPVRGWMTYCLEPAEKIETVPSDVSFSPPRSAQTVDIVRKSVDSPDEQRWRTAHIRRRANIATRDPMPQQNLNQFGMALEEERTRLRNMRKAMEAKTEELYAKVADREFRVVAARERMALKFPGMQMSLNAPQARESMSEGYLDSMELQNKLPA